MQRSFLILLAGLFLALPAQGWAQMSTTELRLQAMEEKLNALTAEDKKKGQPLQAYFKNGFRLMTPDKKFQFQVGGRIMADFAFFDEDQNFLNNPNFGNLESGAEFRRARIFIAGSMWNTIKWKAQYDFAGPTDVTAKAGACTLTNTAAGSTCTTANGVTTEEPSFKDVYIQLVRIPFLENIRIGHFKEPWSLEEQTSSKYITFMERSLMNAFSNGRSLGVATFNNWNKRLTWNVGVFYQTPSESPPILRNDTGPGQWDIGFRLTGLPWYQNKGQKLAHLGFAYRHQELGRKDTIRYRERPEAHLTSFRTVLTNTIAADEVDAWLIEAAAVWGSASIQGEYSRVNFDQTGITPTTATNYDGFYIEASYWLTGERRPYQTASGTFGRVKVKHPFKWDLSGLGAWQLAVRYSAIDLNDENDPNFTGAAGGIATAGGDQEDVTAGLNWHLNNNTRFMLNYVNADIENSALGGQIPGSAAGSLDIYQMRFQVDF
ncbi:MAG: OprO/OprP family phosphate-selective porin [Nitrospinaceae bacterium]